MLVDYAEMQLDFILLTMVTNEYLTRFVGHPVFIKFSDIYSFIFSIYMQIFGLNYTIINIYV